MRLHGTGKLTSTLGVYSLIPRPRPCAFIAYSTKFRLQYELILAAWYRKVNKYSGSSLVSIPAQALCVCRLQYKI